MACISPIQAYRSRELTENGKRSLVFNVQKGYADLPVTIPCGHCIGCRIDHARSWALRCVHESRLHTFNSFVTLTFNDENLPQDTSLCKSHLQLFFKRLRKAGFRFRYFACGEYGDINRRPHYHVIFFGIDFHADRKLYKRSSGGNLYTSESLNRAWPFGHAIIANFSFQTAQYVTKYVIKKRSGPDSGQHSDYQRLDLSTGELFFVDKQFVLMSRRPGIGAEWFSRFGSDVFPSDFLVHQDKKFSVPKYYLNKIEQQSSRLFLKVRAKRRKLLKYTEHLRAPERLYSKSIILKSKEKLKTRSI